LINFVDATNDANHYTKPPPVAQLWQRPRELGDFKRVVYFEVKFSVEGLRFVPIFMGIWKWLY